MEKRKCSWVKRCERRQFFRELTIQARAIASDPNLGFQFGSRHCGWFYNPQTRQIVGDPADIDAPLKSRVLVCHEAGHAAITRYPDFCTCPQRSFLLNALEDCRMEGWLAFRYPGLGGPLRRVNHDCFRRVLRRIPRLPWARQFGLGAICQWVDGVLPAGLHPKVLAVLRQTEQAREEYVQQLPPIRYSMEPEVTRVYERSGVCRIYRRRRGEASASRFEQAVRLASWKAFVVAMDRIWPMYRQLLQADERAGGVSRPQAAPRSKEHLLPPEATPRSKSKRGPQKGLTVAHRSSLQREAHRRVSLLLSIQRKEQPLVRLSAAEKAERYEAFRRQVAPLVEGMIVEVEQRMRRARAPRWRPGYPDGGRVSSVRAMAFDADPSKYDVLWERLTRPVRVDPAILLLVDLSGSMAGAGKIENAFRGVVLMAEALDALNVRFAIHGFQNALIPFKRAADPFDAEMRERLAEMPLEVSNRRPDGHNHSGQNHDGACLRAAAEELMEAPNPDRFLIVISDGCPTGPQGRVSGSDLLKQTVDWIVTETDLVLIGLGLGPETEHVHDFYPAARAGIPVDAMAVELATLLKPILAS